MKVSELFSLKDRLMSKRNVLATITHIEQGVSMSCFISARGQVLVTDTDLDSLIQGLDETIQVQFTQLVLKLE